MRRLVDRVRMRLANALYCGARQLDPKRPVVLIDGHGWIIKLDDIALARISPGSGVTERQTVVGWRKP